MNQVVWPALGQKNGLLSPSVVGRSATAAGQGRGGVAPSASASAAFLRSSSDALGAWTSDADSELPPVLQRLARGEQLGAGSPVSLRTQRGGQRPLLLQVHEAPTYYSNSLVLMHSLAEKLPEGGQTAGQQRYT